MTILSELLQIQITRPWLLWWGIPIAAVVLILLLTRDFIRLPLLPEERRRRRRQRIFIFITRILLISLILGALAHPYVETTEEIKGNPRVTVLIDQSASMSYLDTSFTDALTAELDKHVPTTVRVFGSNLTSDAGSAMLRNLDPGGNLLMITDGNVNQGPALDEVAFYAGSLNASISMINLSAQGEESSVIVRGPSKVVADSESTFEILVTSTGKNPVQLSVSVDGTPVLNDQMFPGTYDFTQQFSKGEHRIEASIGTQDTNPYNNVFYKAVTVLPKPKILLVSQRNSPLELLLRELYDVDKRPSLPTDLSPYYAIVTDDVPAEALRDTKALHDYLIDESGEYYGNGMVFFGGLNSFDRGSYSGSGLEPLLPVKVGKGERKKGNANLIFIIDASGTTSKTKYDENGVAYEDAEVLADVIKSQAVAAVEQIQIDNKVGVIVFGAQMSTESETVEERLADTVKVVQKLDYLYNNRKEVLEKIPRIQGGGAPNPDIALMGAINMLKNAQGDKNIILLTNGRYCAGLGAECPPKTNLLAIANNAHRLYGISFMTIGVGTRDTAMFPVKVDEKLLKDLAKAGDGTYDRATQLNSLMIKWGDPKAKEFGQEFGLVPLSLTHFITRDIEPTAVLNGYSQVVPKDTAELLITADSGQPALTVWRYGNGRVATWTVFAGNNLGQLLNQENSLLLSRTVNWAIGDPQRKEAYFVDIPDTRINDLGYLKVRSDSPVTSGDLIFTKDGKYFTAQFQPASIGFNTLLGQTYGVNRPTEFDLVGMNPDLEGVVTGSGGKVFKPSESDAIIEHIRQMSRRVTVVKKELTSWFLVAGMALLLFEIAVRRIIERRRDR